MTIMDIPQDSKPVEASDPLASAVSDAQAAATATGPLAPEAIDALLAEAGQRGVAVDGPGGLIQQMIGAVLERALETEMAEHLGYERGQAPWLVWAATTVTATPARR